MKFKVTLKDPDTLGDAILEAVEKEFADSKLEQDELDSVIELRQEKVSEICAKWFEYSEYLTVEIDTDKQTITVCKADK